jgi:hypothetical protein
MQIYSKLYIQCNQLASSTQILQNWVLKNDMYAQLKNFIL